MGKKNITILSVSFNSSIHLKRLIENFVLKSSQLENIKFLIVDNTNGDDKALYAAFDESYDVRIIKNNNRFKQRSLSHANALDFGMEHVDTKFTLIVDPDIHIFYKNWDKFCIQKMELNNRTVIGAPYPQWKLGKVHNYPSVVFMFFQTNFVKSFGKTFYPFPKLYKRIYNSIVRKFVRLGGLANKNRLGKYETLQLICKWLEVLTGITSPDTGKEIISQFHDKGYNSIVFNSPYEQSFKKKHDLELKLLAKDFEVFTFDDKPFISHMYSSGVYHWRTQKSSDLNYWISLIKKIEDKIGQS
ncbi:MAG: glycosyltransferase family 2 protein [Candidatus Neomarinimicrobiota bacterium]